MNKNHYWKKLAAGAICSLFVLGLSAKAYFKSRQVEALTPQEYLESLKRQPASERIQKKIKTGWVESQETILRLYTQFINIPGQDHAARTVLTALAESKEKLTASTRQFLSRILTSQDNPAMVIHAASVVGIAMNLEPESEQNSHDIKILSHLARTTSAMSEKVAYLNAMGNSGNTGFIPVLKDLLVSFEPMVREKAAYAMRHMDDPRVKALFEQAMKDPDLNVRIAAVKAIRFQPDPEEYSSLLMSCARSANDRELKNLCSQAMAKLN